MNNTFLFQYLCVSFSCVWVGPGDFRTYVSTYLSGRPIEDCLFYVQLQVRINSSWCLLDLEPHSTWREVKPAWYKTSVTSTESSYATYIGPEINRGCWGPRDAMEDVGVGKMLARQSRVLRVRNQRSS